VNVGDKGSRTITPPLTPVCFSSFLVFSVSSVSSVVRAFVSSDGAALGSEPAGLLCIPACGVAIGTLAHAIVAGKEFGPVDLTLSAFIDAHQESWAPTVYSGSLTWIKVPGELPV
jgi:hypothetical protein